MRYYQQNFHSDWTKTEERPSETMMAHLKRQIKATKANELYHKHNPGDGWHYVMAEPSLVRTSEGVWIVDFISSEGAVLAHAEDICNLLKLDLKEIYRRAYPDERPCHVSKREHSWNARPATLDDYPAVMEDLTDINYHSFRSELEEAILEAINNQ